MKTTITELTAGEYFSLHDLELTLLFAKPLILLALRKLRVPTLKLFNKYTVVSRLHIQELDSYLKATTNSGIKSA